MNRFRQQLTTILATVLQAFVWLSTIAFFGWAIGAIYWLAFLPKFISFVLAIAFAAGVGCALWKSTSKRTTRAKIIVAIGIVYLITLLIRPANDRNWVPEQRFVAHVEITDGNVTIENFRHSVYRSETDFDVRFTTLQFPLNNIDSIWFIVQKFSANEGLAHVFLSFGLSEPSEPSDLGEPKFFSVSVEIRREQGETYGPIQGMYRNYELTHVIGDERDLIGVRTVHRPHDRVYLFRVNASPAQAQYLFASIAERIAKLERAPEFYHSLLNNCANGVTSRTYELTPEPINWLDPKIILPGYSGQFAYEQGLIGDPNSGETFAELESKSRVDELARSVGISEDFSQQIRTPADGR